VRSDAAWCGGGDFGVQTIGEGFHDYSLSKKRIFTSIGGIHFSCNAGDAIITPSKLVGGGESGANRTEDCTIEPILRLSPENWPRR
jgi:hypothetical protein